MRSQQLMTVRVYKAKLASRKDAQQGASETLQRLGKIHATVVNPAGTHVVGFMIKQPDIAGMVKRPDLFVALDALQASTDGLVASDDAINFGKTAAQHRNFDLDTCVIWEGMDAQTTSGKQAGFVRALEFDDKSGELQAIFLTEGGMSDALVGAIRVPISEVQGYSEPTVVVSDAALTSAREGGVAAAAGEASVRVGQQVAEAGSAVAEATGKAVHKGAFELGKLVGKARRGVVEATQAEPDYKELPAQEVCVSDVQDTANVKKSGSSTQKTSKDVELHHNKISADTHKQSQQKASSAANQLARGLGKSLRGTKGMFASFKKEFDKHSK